MKIFDNWLRKQRLRRIRELEEHLGLYQQYGSGPFGSSSEGRREDQLELSRLMAKTHDH